MNLWRRMARVMWWVGDTFIFWGDRAYDRVLKGAGPLDFDASVDATLRANAGKIAANVARNNAVFDDLRKGPKA